MSPRHIRRYLSAGTGLAAAAALAACAPQPYPDVAVRTFLLDWQAGEFEAAARQTDGDPEEVAAALESAHDQLDLAGVRFGLGPVELEDDGATAAFEAQADLGIGDPVWKYTGRMELNRGGDGWRIAWDPSVIHPDLGAGERLAVNYDVPDRGRVFDRNGEPLVGEAEVTEFGVVPAELEDGGAGITELAELLGEDPAPMTDRVRSAPPEDFQPLVLMRTKDVDAEVLSEAEGITGVQTREERMPLSPRAARSVVGEVAGTAEHNISSRVASAYQAGDTVGLSGLQNVFQHRLAGTATTQVVTLDADGGQTGVLKEWPGAASGALTTTLDLTAQQAAQDALEAMPGRAHLVAVDVRTGEVLSAAGDPASFDNDGALNAQYRPGGAFSIVSAAAALRSGAATADGSLACQESTEVGGQTFGNEGPNGVWAQPQTLESAFANGCTSALAGLATDVGEEELRRTAADFGIGADWRLSLPTYSGEVSAGGGAAETAGAMTGAEGVTVSPLGMALAAGAVADGTWHAPRLAVDADDQMAAEAADGEKLDGATVEALRQMMRATVERGQATPANLGTVPVHGQVGQVEQTIGGDATTVQWFVGYQGNVAFAAVAEVDPEQVWDQYALVAGNTFLQGLPAGYVEAGYAEPKTAEEPGSSEEQEGADGAEGGDTGEGAGGQDTGQTPGQTPGQSPGQTPGTGEQTGAEPPIGG
ncbi:penicillin-binding transpeptidase domain-containing protein [Nocardiopsis baichengensis]|uniref:penicillin-binding transpeptidase domain-containing protein n=1 Tax=Nocardiopsis baichengensis TaxID=280240 RepID=UPI00034CEA12|nr:penicillin-binding transpeptidase domain-containing protein [Nocardiopsis baichengensis]